MSSSSPTHPAIFLMGPTAAGKTDIAAQLYQRLPCEIISVDSALVYRGMNIGTAKPDAAFLQKTPHHLIDIRDPRDPYSAADFRHDALALMADIRERGRVPLLVGGTMLYFKALRDGLAPLPPADAEIRRQISLDAAQYGWPHIHHELAQVDPISAARLNPNDPQRLQRALEVYRLTGISLTQWHAEQKQHASALADHRYTAIAVAVSPQDRKVLHQRIEQRFLQMLEQGLIEEVNALRQRGDLSPELPSIRAVGYRQVWEHLDGNIDYNTLIEQGVAATRQLAKRQLTWLRSWPDLRWIHTEVSTCVDSVTNHVENAIREKLVLP